MSNQILTQEEIDAATTLCIAAGMKEMANADDDLHEREVALIDDFLQELKQEQDVDNATVDISLLDSQKKQELFLQCLAMVALADGKIQEQELALLQKYINDFGLSWTPQDVVKEIGKTTLQRFRGTQAFREQAFNIGREFGLSDEEIEEVLG